MLQGKKVLLGITGSIAAYKSILLVRLLVKAGAEVKVIMTPAAKDFVSSLTLSTLSKNKVLIDLFDEESWSNHVMLGRWSDVMIIAPATCNTLAKMANGFCDNLLLATYLSATCPVIMAPAMDEDMWKHPSTKRNLTRLQEDGVKMIPVATGELASGLYGEGRMAEPEQIISYLESEIFNKQTPLQGKKALVSAGPTFEPIDPVRFVGNHSSGKMGVAIAKSLSRKGADVHLVLGPTDIPFDLEGLHVTRVMSAEEMYDACANTFSDTDITVMAAAVADYTPEARSTEKIKKKEDQWSLSFVKTRDILKALGEKKQNGQLLVGFALETQNEKENALEKLKKKNADMIVLNSLNDEGAGFGHETNKVTILYKDGSEKGFPLKSKLSVAEDIVNAIIDKMHA